MTIAKKHGLHCLQGLDIMQDNDDKTVYVVFHTQLFLTQLYCICH